MNEAEAIAKRMIQIDELYIKGYNKLSRIYFEKNEFIKAEETLKKAIERMPYEKDAYNNLGELYKAQGKLEASEAIFMEGLTKFPDFSYFYYNIAELYLMKEEFEVAKSFYQQFIDMDKEDPDGYLLLACTEACLGNTSEARKQLDQAQSRSVQYFEGMVPKTVLQRIRAHEFFHALIHFE